MDTAKNTTQAHPRVIEFGDLCLPRHPWIQPVWEAQLELSYATRTDAWFSSSIAQQMQAHHLILAWRPDPGTSIELLGGFRTFLLLGLANREENPALHILDYGDQLRASQALQISLASTIWPVLANALMDSKAELLLKGILDHVRKALPPDARRYLPGRSNLRTWFSEHISPHRPSPATPSRLEKTIHSINAAARTSEQGENL